MGMYCCCGVKMTDDWVCECDWEGWYLCYEQKRKDIHAIPIPVPIKLIPEKDGIYQVRIFDDCDYSETESQFSTIPKNWGQRTNQAISHWQITYDDGWTGYTGVYAWKELSKESL